MTTKLTPRDERMLDLYSAGRSQAEIVKAMIAEGWYGIDRNRVSGVVFRARQRGDTRAITGDARNSDNLLKRNASRAQREQRKRVAPRPPAPKVVAPPSPVAESPMPRFRPPPQATSTLGKGGCKFVCGEIVGLDTPTCGRPRVRGAYCADCAPRVYAPRQQGRAA